VFLAIFCAPVINQVFTHKRLTAVRAARHYPIAIAFLVIGLAIMHQVLSHKWLATVRTARSYQVEITPIVIGHTLMFLKTCISDRLAAASTNKMLWMPGGPKSIEIASQNWSTACFTYKLR
jgi:hypothetical protein